MGRTTHRQAEVPLTEQERIQLSNARAVVAELSEREEQPEALTELGYEMRMARGRALELAVAVPWRDAQVKHVAQAADMFYDFIWSGKVPD
jgi:hypothetical protein